MRKLEKQGVTNMSVNGNIGAFITSADTIEIRFSDNEKLDVDHIDESNNEEFKEFRENENKKEELDYYIQKILNRNKDLKNIDFEEEYDGYELTEDYDLDDEHDIDEKYIFENEYLSEESKINFDNEIYEGVFDFDNYEDNDIIEGDIDNFEIYEIYEGVFDFDNYEDNDIIEGDIDNFEIYEIYLKKDVKYNNLDMIDSYRADSDGNIENWKLISKISHFLERKNRFSILNRAEDKIITLLESTGIGICERDFLKNGTVEFELLPIINFNGSLRVEA